MSFSGAIFPQVLFSKQDKEFKHTDNLLSASASAGKTIHLKIESSSQSDERSVNSQRKTLSETFMLNSR